MTDAQKFLLIVVSQILSRMKEGRSVSQSDPVNQLEFALDAYLKESGTENAKMQKVVAG